MCRDRVVWYVYLCGMLKNGWSRLGPGSLDTLLCPGCTRPLPQYLDQLQETVGKDQLGILDVWWRVFPSSGL